MACSEKVGLEKSTLVDIISGLITPQEGSLFVDNKKINNPVLLREWQNEISYVTQNINLFKGSLKDNTIFQARMSIMILIF